MNYSENCMVSFKIIKWVTSQSEISHGTCLFCKIENVELYDGYCFDCYDINT